MDTAINSSLLCLLQLASATLPVGAYSYSEGLEMLVEQRKIALPEDLGHWLNQELSYGAVRLEAAVMVRAYQAAQSGNLTTLNYWNCWLSAARETEELRQQSWQMGWSLSRLLRDLIPEIQPLIAAVGIPCNYAIAFGIAAQQWQIELSAALLGYLHSWATNIIAAGIKLIPLGQTVGQQLLLEIHPQISHSATEIIGLEDDSLSSCGWGLALASMNHETQYSRLFRS